MKKYFITYLLLCSIVALAQEVPKPPLTWKDVASWKAIPGFGGTQLSSDGAWFAYVLNPNEGDAEIIIRKTSDTTKIKYPIGSSTSFSMSFSDDAKWFAFKVYPKDKDKKAAAKPGAKPVPDKVFLINLTNKKKTEFERVKTFAFNGEKSSVLALHLTATNAPSTPNADGPKGSDLLLYDLASSKTQNIGNISEYSFNKQGDWLALTVDAAEKAGNGLWVRNMNTNVVMILDNDKASYKSLNWTEKGDGLALLKGTKDEKYKTELNNIVGVKNFSTMPELVSYEPKKDSVAFPKGMTISANRTPYWSEDLRRLFFGITKTELAKKETPKADAKKDSTIKESSEAEKLAKIKADTSIKTIEDLTKAIAKVKTDSTKKGAVPDADKEKPDLTIWHWQDKRLQSRQQIQETQDKNFSFIANYDISSKKFLQLADSSLKNVSIAPKQLYGIAQDITNYELDNNLDGQNYSDVYVVDLKTGKRSKVIEKHYIPDFYANPSPAPDGTKFLYWKDGNWIVFDLSRQTSRNISDKAGTSFIDVEVDQNVRKPPYPVIGWTNDSRFILVSDGWDIWELSVDGSASPQNLTKNGKIDQMRYQNRYVLDPEEKGIDLAKTQYFKTYGEWTKKSGFIALENGQVKGLLWEDTSVGNLTKAKNSNAFVYTRQTFKTAPEYYLCTSTSLENGQKISQNTPSFDKYAWSPSVRLIDYKSDKGDKLQGALFLPAGYEAGKKYPTIIYYYEKLSQTLNNFANPGYSGTGWNASVYTSNGYAVFIPDIVYKLNDPGMSAVWCVIPGVKAAIKTGIIDETKMGLHGHSWGGYQTSFLITQTNMFKAAAAGAPLTDMISMYNLIYKNSGSSNGAIFEASQGRLLPPWENWEAYNRNSPLYHVKKVNTPLLMLHNDADGAVDFTQGIEYYNALRRLKKPVVLIQYKGENHGLTKLPNRKDYAVRMMEFFDYHLKGKPAPEWLEKGIDRLTLDEHLDKRVMGVEE
jgi:dipeptidyl aminopeptidase/acylaminoacyl peptidase